MNLATTYKIFLVKTLKEKRYYWARNVFFLLFPLLFIILTIFTGVADDKVKHLQHGSFRPTTDVSVLSPHPTPSMQIMYNVAKNKQVFISLLFFSRSLFLPLFRMT